MNRFISKYNIGGIEFSIAEYRDQNLSLGFSWTESGFEFYSAKRFSVSLNDKPHDNEFVLSYLDLLQMGDASIVVRREDNSEHIWDCSISWESNKEQWDNFVNSCPSSSKFRQYIEAQRIEEQLITKFCNNSLSIDWFQNAQRQLMALSGVSTTRIEKLLDRYYMIFEQGLLLDHDYNNIQNINYLVTQGSENY